MSDGNRSLFHRAVPVGLTIVAAVVGCTGHPQPKPPTPTPAPPHVAPPSAPSASLPPDDPAAPIPDRVARALVRTCTPADDASASARDSAAAALGRLDLLLNHCEDRVLLGIHDPATSIDPLENKSTALAPLVLAKLYLSLFTFTGTPEVRQQEDYTVVQVAAHFRDRLPAGDYPHPIWHSADEWDAYATASSLLLVFNGDMLSAVYIPKPTAHATAKSPVWDDRWHWTDASGAPQPRVAEYPYLLSPDNPNIPALTAAYKNVQTALRAQGCLACHSPDNKHQAQVLVLLGYPNQALTVHHALPAILRENAMPPGDPRHGVPRGMDNDRRRYEIIALADEFEKAANAALLYESDARGVPRPPPIPTRVRPED